MGELLSYRDDAKEAGEKALSSGCFPPSSDPEEVAKAAYVVYEHASQARLSYEQAMDTNRRFYKGDQIKIRKNHPNIVDNQTRVAVDTVRPRIIKALRDIEIKAVNENDAAAVDGLSLRVEYGLKKSYWEDLILPEAVENMLIEGAAVLKADKTGTVNVIDPKAVFWTPETGFDDAWYWGQQHLMTTGLARLMFDKKLNAGTTELRSKENEVNAPPATSEDAASTLVVSIAPVNQSTPVRRYSSQSLGANFVKATRVWVIELWVDDLTMKEGGLIYPHGRVINIGIGSDFDGLKNDEVQVLMDRPNPFERISRATGRKHPFSYAPYSGRKEPWSDSLVTLLLPLQRGLNDAWNTWIRNAKLVNSPKLLASESLGLKAGSITNDPAQIITVPNAYPYPANSGLTVLNVQPLAQHFIPIRQSFLDAIRDVSGIEDVVRGQNPTGVTAGVALGVLDSNANQRISAPSRSLSLAASQIKENLAYIAQELDEESMMIPDDRIETDSEQISYEPEMAREAELRVVSAEKLPLQDIIRIMSAVAELEAKGLPGEMVLRYVDDPRLYRLFIEKKRGREAFQMQTAKQQQEADVEGAEKEIVGELLGPGQGEQNANGK